MKILSAIETYFSNLIENGHLCQAVVTDADKMRAAIEKHRSIILSYLNVISNRLYAFPNL